MLPGGTGRSVRGGGRVLDRLRDLGGQEPLVEGVHALLAEHLVGAGQVPVAEDRAHHGRLTSRKEQLGRGLDRGGALGVLRRLLPGGLVDDEAAAGQLGGRLQRLA